MKMMMKNRIRECGFCKGDKKIDSVDFKNTDLLRRFITEKGKILPRRISGNCAKHQRIVARAIKRSRHAALMPFKADV